MSGDIEKAIAKAMGLEKRRDDTAAWTNNFERMDHEVAQQDFENHTRNTHKLVWDVVEAGAEILEDIASGDTFGANGHSAQQHRAKAFRDSLSALARAVNGGE